MAIGLSEAATATGVNRSNRVPVSSRGPATGPVHPADARSAHRRRAALESAPFRFGAASRRQVHRPMHGVVLHLFRASLPPGLGC
jgi:hypothetical protein